MRKVGRPVERIDVPAELAFHALPRSLFAVDAVLGKDLGEPSANQLLHGAVGNGDEVHIALVLGLDALCKELAQTRARLPRNRRGLAASTPSGVSGAQEAASVRSGLAGDVPRLRLRARPRAVAASVILRIWCL